MELEARALERVPRDGVIGLGSGAAAERFIRALGAKTRAGWTLRGVPTSSRSEAVAREAGVPLASLDEVEALDLTVDGADEIDPSLDLIKGYGGALAREKIVAAASRRVLILAGREKLVSALGERGRLPIEVLPFAAGFAARVLGAAGLPCVVRASADGGSFRSDNGNVILDAAVGRVEDPAALDGVIRDVPGVVATGFFLGMADEALIEHEGRVEHITRDITRGKS